MQVVNGFGWVHAVNWRGVHLDWREWGWIGGGVFVLDRTCEHGLMQYNNTNHKVVLSQTHPFNEGNGSGKFWLADSANEE